MSPMANFHSGRVRDPDDFLKDKKYWATIILKGIDGIELVTAKLKKDGPSGPMTAQAYRFDKSKFTEKQAKDWLKKHKVKSILFEPAKEEVKEATMITPNFDTVWEKVTKKKKKDLIVPVPPVSMSSRGMTEQKVVATAEGDTYSFKGSYEWTRNKILDVLRSNGEYGKYPSILSTFKDRVYVEAYYEGTGNQIGETKFFEVEYEIEYGPEDVKVTLGDATEVTKKTEWIIKEQAEEIAARLFPINEELLTEAKWTVKMMNDLPDDAFAFIKSGGEKDDEGKTKPRSLRYLPYKGTDGKIDLPHLRNALARLPQTDLSDDEKKKALAKLEKAAKEAGVGK